MVGSHQMNYTQFYHEYRSSRISENLWRKLLQIAEFNKEKNSRDVETEKILGSRYKDDHSLPSSKSSLLMSTNFFSLCSFKLVSATSSTGSTRNRTCQNPWLPSQSLRKLQKNTILP
jgi:hypothetical protein